MNNTKENNKNYAKQWRELNKEYLKKYHKEYREKNKQRRYEQNKEWVQKNKERRFLQLKEWRERNKDKLKLQRLINRDRDNKRKKEYKKLKKEEIKIKNKIYVKNRRKIDLNYKMMSNLRCRVYSIIKKQKTIKTKKSLDLIGCSLEYLKKHLENQFQDGMSWENYGKFGWHIDHIKPCSSFDLTDPNQQKECFNYKNLQPLWWYDNLAKSNKII
jgi:hypothetical protein